MPIPNAYMNWSGGKDSSLCLYELLQSKQFNITHLLTSVNAVHDRISMHGVRRALLEAQAHAVGIPLKTIELPEAPGMQAYEQSMSTAVHELRKNGCTHAAFGDIFLEDLRAYREKKLRELDMTCVFPLWKKDTAQLVQEFIDVGFKAIIVCLNDRYLDKSFCGRIIDQSFINDLPPNVDPCGENGEFHSYVFDGPLFRYPIPFVKGEIVYRTYAAPKDANDCHTTADPSKAGFYFCDLIPSNS